MGSEGGVRGWGGGLCGGRLESVGICLSWTGAKVYDMSGTLQWNSRT